jgi:hypothetical protein
MRGNKVPKYLPTANSQLVRDGGDLIASRSELDELAWLHLHSTASALQPTSIRRICHLTRLLRNGPSLRETVANRFGIFTNGLSCTGEPLVHHATIGTGTTEHRHHAGHPPELARKCATRQRHHGEGANLSCSIFQSWFCRTLTSGLPKTITRSAPQKSER